MKRSLVTAKDRKRFAVYVHDAARLARIAVDDIRDGGMSSGGCKRTGVPLNQAQEAIDAAATVMYGPGDREPDPRFEERYEKAKCLVRYATQAHNAACESLKKTRYDRRLDAKIDKALTRFDACRSRWGSSLQPSLWRYGK